MADKTVFRLYALPTANGTVANMLKSENAYLRVTEKYTLMYTDGERPSGGVQVMDDDLALLTESDAMWLENCNLEILAKWAQEHEKAAEEGRREFMERFVKELEFERARQKATRKGALKCRIQRKQKESS